MLISQGDARMPPLAAVKNVLKSRLRDALCLPAGWAGKVGDCLPPHEAQKGSAVVEFTFLALLLMVPVVYFVVTVGQIQGGSFAVVGAADQAAKVFVTQRDPVIARTAAERSVLVALKDHGYSPEQASIAIECDRGSCLSAGATVTVTVRLDVPLPLMPFGDSLRLNASRLSASASQVVGRYQ
ncbi:hypothetical protein [Pseudarthrobacter sp. PvP004]|uniref:hypothetical protein n=1 Tax=Pseudarthrobacter sp. PvP004 TaxID=2817850 RepID=UPI001AEA1C80|nr:hypothetical protein [Pseudarthrobacter sp. PvP004]